MLDSHHPSLSHGYYVVLSFVAGLNSLYIYGLVSILISYRW